MVTNWEGLLDSQMISRQRAESGAARVRSRYLKEGGDLFSLSRLIFETFMAGRLSPEGTGLGDEEAMWLLDCVVVEGKGAGLLGSRVDI